MKDVAEVVVVSVDAILILKDVEPFSIDIVGGFVVDSVRMKGTEVEGMSVDAKLILKGVEPFSIDVVGGFVVDSV